jgi:nickel-dependent lactate racemase
MYFGTGSPSTALSTSDLREALGNALGALGERRQVLAVPPDFTRLHSRAGEITRLVADYFGPRLGAILPALGTHSPMTEAQIAAMFGDLPRSLFRVHDWRRDVVTLGEVPAAFVAAQSEGRVEYSWPAQVNRLLVEGGFDLICSIGQVVPHEVIGMANHNKNIFVGTGGAVGIDRSHYLGAVYGMERIMGRADNPVRRVLDYASERFARRLPILYILTVIARDEAGRLATRGLFVGDDSECFERAAALSLRVNLETLPRAIRKAVVYLNPSEFKSTWLGNKAIYRTRMALADGAELIVLAPGVREFGEDPAVDRLIRKHGYAGTSCVLKAVRENADLAGSLGAAAHLIHGSSEGRFTVTYCPGHLTREEIESAGFRYGDLDEMTARYDPGRLKDGFNTAGDEEIFFISNPALGLWTCPERTVRARS